MRLSGLDGAALALNWFFRRILATARRSVLLRDVKPEKIRARIKASPQPEELEPSMRHRTIGQRAGIRKIEADAQNTGR